MTKPSDEVLMAFADGELDPARRREVADQVAADVDVRKRLDVFLQTGQPLANVFAHKVAEEVPHHLTALVRDYAPESPKGRPVEKAGRRLMPAIEEFAKQLFGSWQLATAGAITAGCVLFVAGGLVLGPLGGDTNSNALALGPVSKGSGLAQRLESQVSGVVVPVSGSSQRSFRSDLSFRSQSGHHCRRFVIALGASDKGIAAIACRSSDDATWTVRTAAQTRVRRRETGAVATAFEAERNGAIEAALDHMMSDDAYGADDEKRLIARNWR